jgi:hypothetical protein
MDDPMKSRRDISEESRFPKRRCDPGTSQIQIQNIYIFIKLTNSAVCEAPQFLENIKFASEKREIILRNLIGLPYRQNASDSAIKAAIKFSI